MKFKQNRFAYNLENFHLENSENLNSLVLKDIEK